MKNLPGELAGAFAKRPVDASKYSVGTVSVVGGSDRYPHAPVIAGLGARVAGAGLVQLVVPDASRIAAGAHVPEATVTKLDVDCELPRADVTVLGMGLGRSETTKAIASRILSGSQGRFVIDADALAYELNDMEKAIRGEGNGMYLAYTKDVMDMMTEYRNEWGLKYPEEP